MNISEQIKFCLVNPGTMGEPEVLQALLGPNIKSVQATLDGFDIRKQVRPPENVWEGIKAEWDDKGHPFPGAWTLAKNEGSKAEVRGVEFGSKDEVKAAIRKLDFWNYHDRENPQDEWYGYSAFRVEDTVYLTEVLRDENLIPVSPNYREEPDYKSALLEMTRQANDYRISTEGSQTPLQQKI